MKARSPFFQVVIQNQTFGTAKYTVHITGEIISRNTLKTLGKHFKSLNTITEEIYIMWQSPKDFSNIENKHALNQDHYVYPHKSLNEYPI